MTRKDGVVVVNGRVHAICTATRKPTIYQVLPDHFEKCSACVIFGEIKEWEDMQVRVLFRTGLEATVVCGVSCGRCTGYKGKLYHSQASRIPKKPYQHLGWPGA